MRKEIIDDTKIESDVWTLQKLREIVYMPLEERNKIRGWDIKVMNYLNFKFALLEQCKKKLEEINDVLEEAIQLAKKLGVV